MHTYRKVAQGDGNGAYLYTVGIAVPGYTGVGLVWHSLADFAREGDAAAFAAWMNGGTPPRGVLNEMFPDINWS